jgi:type I restriction enzyme S subunit
MNSEYHRIICDSSKTDGVNQSNINAQKLSNFLFPIPPFSEQKRIALAIKSTFALINNIEASKLSLEQFIKQAKSKVLDLAIRGKLVAQNPYDEPASALLERVRSEQKTKKPTADIFPYPFEIPKSWTWCRFSELYTLLSGRDLENTEFNSNGNGIPYLIGASNLNNGKFEINRWTNAPKVVSIKNDLLITCKGTVGELVINNIDRVHIARQFMAVRTIANVDTQYTKCCFYFFLNSIKENAKGIIPGISRNDILDLLIPLPPLFEQRRIVQKIETVFKELDFLQDNL